MTQVTLPATFDSFSEFPETLWVEGVEHSDASRDIGLRLGLYANGLVTSDQIAATALQVDLHGDMNGDGYVDSNDPNDITEEEGSGLVVPLNDGPSDHLVKFSIRAYPSDWTGGKIYYRILPYGEGHIKIWNTRTKNICLLDSSDMPPESRFISVDPSANNFGSGARDFYIEGLHPSSTEGDIVLKLFYQNPDGTTHARDKILITVSDGNELDVYETARPNNRIGWNDSRYWIKPDGENIGTSPVLNPSKSPQNRLLVWADDTNYTTITLTPLGTNGTIHYAVRKYFDASVFPDMWIPIQGTTPNTYSDQVYSIQPSVIGRSDADFRVVYGSSPDNMDHLYEIYVITNEQYQESLLDFELYIFVMAYQSPCETLYDRFRSGTWDNSSSGRCSSVKSDVNMTAETDYNRAPGTTHNFGANHSHRGYEYENGRLYSRSDVSMPVYYYNDLHPLNGLIRSSKYVKAGVEEFIDNLGYSYLNDRYGSTPVGTTTTVEVDFSESTPFYADIKPKGILEPTGDREIGLGYIRVWPKVEGNLTECRGVGELKFTLRKDSSGKITVSDIIIDMTVDDVFDFNHFNGMAPHDAAILQCFQGRPGTGAGVGDVALVRAKVIGDIDMDDIELDE